MFAKISALPCSSSCRSTMSASREAASIPRWVHSIPQAFVLKLNSCIALWFPAQSHLLQFTLNNLSLLSLSRVSGSWVCTELTLHIVYQLLHPKPSLLPLQCPAWGFHPPDSTVTGMARQSKAQSSGASIIWKCGDRL